MVNYAFLNCDIYTGDEVVSDKALLTRRGIIEGFSGYHNIPEEYERIDLGGKNVSPGFIDLQINGGGGILFNNEPTAESIEKIRKAHMKFGTTNFLVTLITDTDEKMMAAMQSATTYRKKSKSLLGIHFEGPFISEKKAGVHSKEYIRTMDKLDIDDLVSDHKDFVVMMTVAPERISEEEIKHLSSLGVILSAGHTDASYEEAKKGFESGIITGTHLYNAMSSLTSREPGTVGAILDNKKVSAGIIVDGLHVSFPVVRITKRVMGSRLFLVTDAMPPVGSDSTGYTIGSTEIFVRDGKCVTKDGILAGSSLNMATAVRNCVQHVGIPTDEALRMASTYPAEVIGMGDKLGRIEKGFLSNLTIFNNQIQVAAVVSEGQYIDFHKE